MPNIAQIRPAGPTLGLSVVAASHAAVALTLYAGEYPTWVACLNTGPNTVAIKFSQTGVASVLPGDGTTGDYILPALMTGPVLLPLTSLTPYVTAIGSAAGPALVYVTPVSPA